MNIIFFLLPLLIVSLNPSTAHPLYTKSRWIVDEGARRVKLTCTNFDGERHLSKHSLEMVSKQMASMGFNCVRLASPPLLFHSITLRAYLQNFRLLDGESIAAVQLYNPHLLDLPLIQAYQQAMASNLADNNLMVIIDPRKSETGWWSRDAWLNGLAHMATLFNGSSRVVAMTLGDVNQIPKPSARDWYRYLVEGAEVVHSANPDVLVILPVDLNLDLDLDLDFLLLKFKEKLVLEVQWSENLETLVREIRTRGGGEGWPLILSEFRLDGNGREEIDLNDDRNFKCMVGVAAEFDLGLDLWGLERSYLLRGEETARFLQQISPIQPAFQGPHPHLSGAHPYKKIFHPSDGLCVVRKSLQEPLKLGPCAQSESWSYSPQKNLVIKGTYFCLEAVGAGKPAKLGVLCVKSNTKWEVISESKMHLSSKLADGSTLCLDVGSNNNIITNPCKCLSIDQECDTDGQWFQVIESTKAPVSIAATSLSNFYSP